MSEPVIEAAANWRELHTAYLDLDKKAGAMDDWTPDPAFGEVDQKMDALRAQLNARFIAIVRMRASSIAGILEKIRIMLALIEADVERADFPAMLRSIEDDLSHYL